MTDKKIERRFARCAQRSVCWGVVFVVLVGMLTLFAAGCIIDINLTPLIYNHDEPVQEQIAAVPINSIAKDGHQKIVANTRNEPRTYEITLNSETELWRVYFVITNTGDRSVATPKVSVLEAPPNARHGRNIQPLLPGSVSSSNVALSARVGGGEESGLQIPATKYIHFDLPDNPRPSRHRKNDVNRATATDVCPRDGHNDVEGTTTTFNLPIPTEKRENSTIRVTARMVRTVGNQRVVFWTPDSVYTGCTGDGCLPEEGLLLESDIAELANSFLKEGSNNDIYDWMQSLFGDHWGDHDHCGDNRFIGSGHANQIDILLYNIGSREGDKAYTGQDGELILGYFWPINNYSRGYARLNGVDRSNERLLMALHAPWIRYDPQLLLQNEVDERYIVVAQDRYRYRAISAMAHEHQHLIHFYQRNVLDTGRGERGERDPTWLNEQFSVMTQDILHNLLADGKHSVFDQRGRNGLSAGGFGNCLGEGVIGNYTHTHGDRGVTQWEGDPWNYGLQFSFGAYMLRNYGGADFLRDAYQTSNKGTAAVSTALSIRTNGMVTDMGEAVRRWGVAKLLSDQIDAPDNYRVNSGPAGFGSVYENQSYNTGSINYYNYVRSCSNRNNTGALRLFTTTESAFQLRRNAHDAYANIILAAIEGLEGSARFKVTLSPGHALTIVNKYNPTIGNPVFY